MEQRNVTYFNKKTALVLLWLCWCYALLYPSLSLAGSYTNCIPSSANGKYTTECPNGQIARNDINVQCVRNQNQNSCLNTMPVAGNVARIPEDVCYRNAGWSNKRNHNGIDYAAGKGTPVIAAADGVATVNMCVSGGGRTVVLTHMKASSSSDGIDIVSSNSNGFYTTIYMHLASITVGNGAQVKKGQQIGTVGGSSCSGGKIVEDAYGDHLHFELRDGDGGIGKGNVLDPLCSDIQSLCETQSSNRFYEGVSTSGYSPGQCRDCISNPEACQASAGIPDYVPADGSLAQSWEGTSAQTAANELASTNDGDCKYSSYRSSFDTCFFCDIFKILFNTASRLAEMAYTTLSGSVIVLVLVGTAIWLAFLILKYVSSFETKDPRNMMKEIFNQLFVVAVVVFLLQGTTSISFMSLVISPIFETGISLANIVLADTSGNTCRTDVLTGIISDGGLPVSIGTSIVCVIDAIQNKIADVIALGSTSMCVGLFVESWKEIPLLPHWGYLLSGLIIWIAGLLMLLIYPWLLIDAMLQLCLSVMFLPIAIGAYAFKYTRQMFVGKVWGAFMSAMFMFVFLAIVISILLLSIESTVGENFNRTLTNDATGINAILQNLGWWTISFLKLVFTLLLAWAVLGEAQSFAGKFASGIGAGGGLKAPGNIGSNVGTLANSGLKSAALLGAKGGIKAAKSASPLISEKMNNFKMARNKNHMNKRQSQFANKGKVNADGSVSYTNRWGRKFTQTQDGYSYKTIFGRTVTKKVTKNENGAEVYTRERKHKNGKITSVSNDGYIKKTTRTDKDGNIREKIKMTTAAGRRLIKNDGSLNQVAINNIMQNSGFSDAETQEAILQQLMRERFPDYDANKKYNSYKSKSFKQGVDENGNSYFSVTTQNSDGSTSVMSMTFNQKGNRAMTSWEEIDSSGKASKRSSDGILNLKENYNYKQDGTIDENSYVAKYSASKYYHETCGRVVDSNGKIARGVPINETLFSDAHFSSFGNQVAHEGTPNPLAGFK